MGAGVQPGRIGGGDAMRTRWKIALGALLLGAGFGCGWFAGRSGETDRRVVELEKQLAVSQSRIARLEGAIGDAIGGIKNGLAIGGEGEDRIDNLIRRVDGIIESVSRLERVYTGGTE